MRPRKFRVPRGWVKIDALPTVDGFRFLGLRAVPSGVTAENMCVRTKNRTRWLETADGREADFYPKAWKVDLQAQQPEPQGIWQRWDLQRAMHNESDDCVVRAFAAASGMTYSAALELHAKGGRKARKGMRLPKWQALWERHGFKLGEALPVGQRTIRSVVNEVPELRTGVWIILTTGHVTCMRDGHVHDWAGNSRKRVIWVKPFETVTPVTQV